LCLFLNNDQTFSYFFLLLQVFHYERVNAFATFGNLWSNFEFWEFSICQFEICHLCTIVFLGEVISNFKSLEFFGLRFKHYILGKVVSIFCIKLCALCCWEKWSLFLHHIYGHCVFRRGGLCLASHLCASCLYALCFCGRWSLSLHHIYVYHVYMHCVFGFGIENHLHLGFKGKTTFMCILFICIVFLWEVVFVFASHLCASCPYALCFWFWHWESFALRLQGQNLRL